jgi:hypothetical protein
MRREVKWIQDKAKDIRIVEAIIVKHHSHNRSITKLIRTLTLLH